MPTADEQRTQVLPATGEQPAVEESSPGAAWAKGDQETQPDQPTAFAAQPAPVRDLPAGVDAGDLSTGPPASARRGKLRRRLGYLRRVRELLLRDLGGFTYEVHRTAGGMPQETHRRLSEAKAKRISALDVEVAAIEAQLGEPHADPVLRVAGIGGTCPECGELHASDARFCTRCGAPLDAKARGQRQAVAEVEAAPEPPPASVLWAGGPRPTSREDAGEDEPAAVTSEWLVGDRPTTFDRSPATDEPADERVAADEPATTAHEPAEAGDEPAATADEPVAADEPATAAHEPAEAGDEPASAHERAAAADEPATTAHEPAAATDEPATTANEPTTTAASDESATAATDEPATTAHEPTTTAASDESATAASDEPATVAGDDSDAEAPDEAAAAADDASRGDEATRDAAGGDDAAKPGEGFEPGPNGRRDKNVRRPVTSGDPLSSRREQTP